MATVLAPIGVFTMPREIVLVPFDLAIFERTPDPVPTVGQVWPRGK